jgi:virulence-associated protein VapD
MKQTLLCTLSFFTIATFMTACSTTQVADEMAVVGNPSLSSDPCAAIDEKVIRLDRFTAVVKNTSAFHLEEKATAIPTPGITVSNNRKQMLKDAEKKYAEYAAERQKYGCVTPVTTDAGEIADQMPILDRCAAIDAKAMQLDRFTEVVKNTSAFHLEEKATAIPTPGITASNNRKQMLRDAEKKYAEYAAERKKYGCQTPVTRATDQIAVASKPALSSKPSAVTNKEPVKLDESTTKVNNTSAVHVEEKAAVLPVSGITVSSKKEEVLRDVEKKDVELSAERKKYSDETPIPATTQMDEKMSVSDNVTLSSEVCDDINIDLIKLYEFTIMVNNTSAFHLEEKASALPSPGFTVSNNKKKMLRDAEKKRVKLLAKQQKYGCETSTK